MKSSHSLASTVSFNSLFLLFLAMGNHTQDYKVFLKYLKTDATKKTYLQLLEKFRKDNGITNLAKVKPKELQHKLSEYLIDMKESGKSYSVANSLVSALQKYCLVYDIEGVNFKKVRLLLDGELVNPADTPYTMAEISKMLEAGDLRLRVIILLMVSSGMRVGALPELRLKDLKKLVNGLYRITVYDSSPRYRYITFTTPECAQAIDAYLDWRTRRGEPLTPEAPLLRLEFSNQDANEPKPMSVRAIIKAIFTLVVNTGIRKVGDRKVRQKTMLTHSFRKIANTAFVKSGIKSVVVELLLGHDTKLQKNYLRLSEEELMAEYLKAVDLLTISKERVLLKELKKLQIENSDLEALKAEVYRLNNRINTIKDEVRTNIPDTPQTLLVKRKLEGMSKPASAEDTRKRERKIKAKKKRA